jgi:hypothetical protein
MIEVKRRVSILIEALRLLDEILTIVPEQRNVLKHWPKLRHECGYFDRGIIQRTVRNGIEKTFHTGLPIDWPRFTALAQCLADRLSQCGLEFHDTYDLKSEMIGDARLIKERLWRPCMDGLRLTLNWELKEAEAEASEQRTQPVRSPATKRTKPRGSKKKSDELICEVLNSGNSELIRKWVFANKFELAELCGSSPGTAMKTQFWKNNRASEKAKWSRENGGRRPQRKSET